MCRQSFLYPNPALVFPMTGNPGVWSVQLPNDPGLFGQAYCLQGFSVNPGGCLDATDGLVLVLQR